MLPNMDLVCDYTFFFLSCPVFAYATTRETHPHPRPRLHHRPPLPNQRTTYPELDGPGCIQHIWVVLTRPEHRRPEVDRRGQPDRRHSQCQLSLRIHDNRKQST